MRPSAMSTTALHDAALSDRSPSSAVVTPTEVPPPVREQIEGVVAQALSRTAASSTASIPNLHRTHLGGASAAGAASDRDSSGASTPASQPVPAQSAQQQLQQRLGALAAALDAGDAVGKLMANMVMSAGASGAGSTNSSIKPRR
jgi:transcription elongation factor